MSEENLLDKAEDILDDLRNEDGKVPQMLNVLTILTFIGAGLGILFSVLMLVGAGAFLSQIPGFNQAGGGNLFGLSLVLLVANAACFYGAMKMRKLSKQGFYIYVVGHVISLLGGILLGGAFSAMGLVFPVLFIVLYGLNLKHLK